MGIVCIRPEIRCGGFEFHAELVNAGGFFAPGPYDAPAHPTTGFFAVDNERRALRPVDRGEDESSVKIDYRRDDLQGLAVGVDF